MIRVRAAAALVLALAFAGTAAAADKVHLRSGKVVEGTIESHDGDVIVVRAGAETLRIPQRLVDRVELGSRAAAPKGAPAASATPKPSTEPAAGGTAPAPAAAGAGKPANSAPAPVASAPLPVAPTTAADRMLLTRLAAESTNERAAAQEAVVAGWPATAGTLDAALRHADASVRRDAVSLLERKELGDTAPRIRSMLADGDATVRANAVRQVRNRGILEVEPTLVRLLSSDSAVMVRLEALRTLEDVGTAACLPAVLAAWKSEAEDVERDRRRRYLRVLRKHTGEDAGEDRTANAEAWRAAIERASRRKPGEKPPPKPAAPEAKVTAVDPDARGK